MSKRDREIMYLYRENFELEFLEVIVDRSAFVVW